MSLLNKLTINNLKLNKKRTIVTIIGIMLSSALIMVVMTMFTSMVKTLTNYQIYSEGKQHVTFYNVSSKDLQTIKNTRGVDEIYITNDIGYASIESKNIDKPYACIKAFNNTSIKNLSIKLVDGRLPTNNNEIIIPSHLKTNGKLELKIGDVIKLKVGNRVVNNKVLYQDSPLDDKESIKDTTNKTYKVVGIMERPSQNVEDFESPGYTFITYLNESNMTGNLDVYVRYTNKGVKDYLNLTATILGVDKDAFNKLNDAGVSDYDYDELYQVVDKAKYNYNINSYLISLEINVFNNDSVRPFTGAVTIILVIIVITSIFCIKNSFDISINEKNKQYGMLKSIGATKKQIRNNVFYEATILAIIGIPLGLLLGVVVSYVLIIICKILLKDLLTDGLVIYLSYSYISFLISIILGIITIYLSAFNSAFKASRMSCIDSIRNNNNIKINPKKIRSPKIINKIFKIGGEISYKNIKRSKKKYRTTVISIIISVSIFISLSYFINNAFKYLDNTLKASDYDISLINYSCTKSFEQKALTTISLDNINDYSIYKLYSMSTITTKDNYNKDYFNYQLKDISKNEYENDNISIYVLNENQYKKYLKSLGLNYQNNKDKAILLDNTMIFKDEKQTTTRKYNYHSGNKIKGIINKKTYYFYIASTTSKAPFGLADSSISDGMLVVSDKYYSLGNYSSMELYYKSDNVYKLQNDIEQIIGDDDESNINNVSENARIARNVFVLLSIFLYGFIVVVSLIGVTNIFNVITTNMELRKSEFASLKSIGMTNKEFNDMIRLESLFIGLKSLIIGVPIGIILSYIIHISLEEADLGSFNVPIIAIIISIIVVLLLISLLMKYSLNKINKQNTIETIRNENI